MSTTQSKQGQKPTPKNTDQGKGIKRNYLVNARYDHPPVGGLPFPTGICFHGYTTFKLKETQPGKGITEKRALAAAIKEGASELGLTITSVSLLPINW